MMMMMRTMFSSKKMCYWPSVEGLKSWAWTKTWNSSAQGMILVPKNHQLLSHDWEKNKIIQWGQESSKSHQLLENEKIPLHFKCMEYGQLWIQISKRMLLLKSLSAWLKLWGKVSRSIPSQAIFQAYFMICMEAFFFLIEAKILYFWGKKKRGGEKGARSQFPVDYTKFSFANWYDYYYYCERSFPYMFEFRQGTLLCRVIYYPSLPVSSSLLHPYLGAHTDREPTKTPNSKLL